MVKSLNDITETEFRQQIIDLAKLFKWKVYFSWTSIHSPRGWPDLSLCKPPRLVFAELKTLKGVATPEQMDWLAKLSGVPGTEVFLWRPNDWESIQEVLTKDQEVLNILEKEK